MLGSFFWSKGYTVLTAANGTETLKQVEHNPDIILLDICMPGLDGLEVCRHIRDYISCPILFLTARIEDTDKVKGFAAGGDDYIVKPFSLMELEARVKAHLRRETRHNFEVKIKFSSDLVIDYTERCLFFQGKRIGFAKREFDIVEFLSQNPGQMDMTAKMNWEGWLALLKPCGLCLQIIFLKCGVRSKNASGSMPLLHMTCAPLSQC